MNSHSVSGTPWHTAEPIPQFSRWVRFLPTSLTTDVNNQLSFVSALAIVSVLACGGRRSDDTASLGGGSGSLGGGNGSLGGGSGSLGGGSGGSIGSSGGADIGGRSTGGGARGPTPNTLCESADATGVPQGANARIPLRHRASPCCPSQRGPGPGDQPYPPNIAGIDDDGHVACSSDAQCQSGTNGRCFPFEGLVGPGGCSYDECTTDLDCPSGMLCLCRGGSSDDAANVCAPAGNCTVDSNCGPGGYCSPSQDSCDSNRYFCHTALDTCIDDEDCPQVTGADQVYTHAVCAYDPKDQHWGCTQRVCYPP